MANEDASHQLTTYVAFATEVLGRSAQQHRIPLPYRNRLIIPRFISRAEGWPQFIALVTIRTEHL